MSNKVVKLPQRGEEIRNTSGVEPLGHAVLVRTEPPKTGMIELPESVRDRIVMAEQWATVIEIGGEAWKEEGKPRCEVGDKVIFTKYAGFGVPGKDGKIYRVVNDRDIFMREKKDE